MTSAAARRLRRAGLAVLVAALPLAALAQQRTPDQEISASQRRLQEIRNERRQLRSELQQLRGQASNVSAELQNIQRQRAVSETVLKELELQLGETERKIQETTAELEVTQAELAEKRTVLDRRLRDLYKQGPLHRQEVLLSAGSFSDLLNRYKYLHMIARRDRGLVEDVEELTRQLTIREQELRRSYTDLQYLQNERATETRALADLQSSRGSTLSTLRRHERTATQRLEELARDERRLTGLIANLETRRREAERRERDAAVRAPARAGSRAATTTAASTMTTADMGNLAWPVSGRVLYRFGRAPQEGGTSIRYNGIGIGAAAGTPVRAVEAGTVEMAAPFEGYGPTVVVSHGGGYYSLYLYLREVQVAQGAKIEKNQVVGTVGGEHTPEGAHVEFQIRSPGGQAVDPLTWLRRQSR